MTLSTPSKFLLVAAAVTAGLALAQGLGAGKGPGPHHGPPQEAVQACTSLTEGVACGFELNGQNLTGTCVTRRNGSGLVCHAAGMGPGAMCQGGCDGGMCPGCGPGHHGGPPPALTQACTGKAAGAACSFAGRDGGNVEGTCMPRPMGGELVCHPQGTPMGPHHGPPPESFKACEGKASGAGCTFPSRSGAPMTGTCFSPSADKPLHCRP